MVIIWKGKGIWFLNLVAIVLAVGILTRELEKHFGFPLAGLIRDTVGMERFMGVLLLLLPGIPMIVLGVRQHLRGRLPCLEPESGRIVMVRPAHTLWFVNVCWWGAAASLLGLVLILH